MRRKKSFITLCGLNYEYTFGNMRFLYFSMQLDADPSVCRAVLKQDDHEYVNMLVVYFQMVSLWKPQDTSNFQLSIIKLFSIGFVKLKSNQVLTKTNKSNCLITFDIQLKTTLNYIVERTILRKGQDDYYTSKSFKNGNKQERYIGQL